MAHIRTQGAQRPWCHGAAQNNGAWHRLPLLLNGSEPPVDAVAPCCGFTRRKEHAACGPARLGVFSGRGCTCDGLLNMSYEWRPIGCKLRPWNASRFCELLHGRVLLLAGDSTMEQVAHVLRSYIRWESYGRTGDPDATCATNVHFGLSDTLTGKTLGRLNRGRTLDDYVNKTRPGVAIVSAGAHIYGEDHFDAVLRHVRDGLARKYPAVRFVWKTQGPAGCGDERPLASLPTYDSPFWAVEHALPPTQKPRDEFNHRLFLQRDAHAKRFFGELNGSLPHRGLRRQLVNVLDTTPLHYRADAHLSSPGTRGRPKGGSYDCLHLCYGGGDGGPLGLVPRLLLNGVETGQIDLM